MLSNVTRTPSRKCSMFAHQEPKEYPHGGFISTQRRNGPTVSSLLPNLCVLFWHLSKRSCCMKSCQTPLTMSSSQTTLRCCNLSSDRDQLCEPMRACMFSIVVSIASTSLDANVPMSLAFDGFHQIMQDKYALVNTSLRETVVNHVQIARSSNNIPECFPRTPKRISIVYRGLGMWVLGN